MFETDGSVAETEVSVRARVLQGVYRRGNSVSVAAGAARFERQLQHLPRVADVGPAVNVQVRREADYYAQQSRALTWLIRTVGFGIAALIGIGACSAPS